MVWNVAHATPSFTVAPSVAAGEVLQDGWVETGGNTNEVLASGLVAQTAIIANPWLNARVMRPLIEAKRNSRMVLTYVAPAVGTPSMLGYLRGNHGKSNFTGYIPFVSQAGDNFRLYPCVNGVLKTLVNAATGITTVVGTQYQMDVEVVQTDISSSTLTYTLRTAGGVQIGNTMTIVDTTPELQNIAGVAGFGINANAVNPVGLGRIAAATTYAQPPVASTGYTVVAPASGAVDLYSDVFYVYPNNDGPFSDIIVTPNDNGGGGTFTPASVAFVAGLSTPVTFRYRAASAGIKTISYDNDGGLTDQADTSYAATVYNIVGVGDGLFSPGNWKGDTGRGGTLHRKTWNVGAWLTYKWLASATPSASLLIELTATTDKLSIYLNGILTDAVPATGNTALSGVIPSQVNTLKVYVQDSINNFRWNDGLNTVQINGLMLDLASTIIPLGSPMPWGIISGDSITQGVKANAGVGAFNYGYAFGLEKALEQIGYALSVNACSQVGWLVAGDGAGDVPAYYKVAGGVYDDALSRWNKIDQGVSLLDSNGKISAYGDVGQEPSFIITNLLTNDLGTGANVSDVQAAVQQVLLALRVAAPSAAIIIVVPPGLQDTSVTPNTNSAVYVAALKAGFNAYVTAHPNDGLVDLVDLGLDFARTLSHGVYTTDFTHPAAPGHSLVISAIILKLSKILDKLHNRWTY